MKKLLTLLTISLSLLTAGSTAAMANETEAGSSWRDNRGSDRGRDWRRPDRGPDRGRGRDWRRPDRRWDRNISCAATDAGFEEHWGGHRSCGECLAQHGRCIETCQTNSFVCHAEGLSRFGRDTFEAYSDRSEAEARDEALDRCYDSGARNCRAIRCDSNRQIVSQNSCR